MTTAQEFESLVIQLSDIVQALLAADLVERHQLAKDLIQGFPSLADVVVVLLLDMVARTETMRDTSNEPRAAHEMFLMELIDSTGHHIARLREAGVLPPAQLTTTPDQAAKQAAQAMEIARMFAHFYDNNGEGTAL